MSRPSLRCLALALSLVGCGTTPPDNTPSDAGFADAPAVADTPAVTDAPAVTDTPAVTDAPAVTDTPAVTVTCMPGDCGPHGHAHGSHCHCDDGFIDRDNCCVPPPPCSAPDDDLEDNDTPGQATAVPASGARWESLRVCPADADVFRIPLRTGQSVVIRATFTHRDGDIDLYLYAPRTADLGHARPLAGSDGSVDNERIAYTARADGDHLLRVVGFNGAENAYGLSIEPAP